MPSGTSGYGRHGRGFRFYRETHLCPTCHPVGTMLHEQDCCQGHVTIPGTNHQRQCLLPPATGFDRCASHLPRTGLVKLKRAKIERDEAIKRMTETLGTLFDLNAPPIESSVETLQKLAGILLKAFEDAGARLNELSSVGIETKAGGEQLRAEVQLWEKLIGHLRATLVDMARLNLDERALQLDERRADLMATQLFWFLAQQAQELHFDARQKELTKRLMAETVRRFTETNKVPELLPGYSRVPGEFTEASIPLPNAKE